VLAVVVCHNGQRWLPETLAGLRAASPAPRHILAVDTGSEDGSGSVLAEAAGGADGVLDGVLSLGSDVGFGAAVAAAVAEAERRWGDPGTWLWLLHDDCAPEPDCLAALVAAAEFATSAALLGPLAVDWDDAQLLSQAGLSMDSAGHPHAVGLSAVPDAGSSAGGLRQAAEVLAVPSAGALVTFELWQRLSGYDGALPLFCDDIDFGWRANRAGALVLCVPGARVRHARAATRGLRDTPALGRLAPRSAERAHGLRCYLVNCSALGFRTGLARLVPLCVLRGLGFVPLRRFPAMRAEFAALGYLLGGRAGLLAGRAARGRASGEGHVRGLLISRFARLGAGLRRGPKFLMRRRVPADTALGRLPAAAERTVPVPRDPPARLIGPEALPAGALRGLARGVRSGLARPERSSAVPLDDAAGHGAEAATGAHRPSPGRSGNQSWPDRDLSFGGSDRRAVIRALLLAPPVWLVLGLTAVALLAGAGRLSLDLSGGRLLAGQGLAATWSDYLANWHSAWGGTSAPAPAALAVLGILGVPLLFAGGPPAAVSVLLLGDAPIAGLVAYAATRRLSAPRWARALIAAGYALLPPATSAIAQGRIDTVVVHLLLPAVLAGIAALLRPPRARQAGRSTWFSGAVLTALGMAVIGAFSPLIELCLVALALIGFVAIPAGTGTGPRRVVALFVVVLLPLLLLVPWPAAVLRHPTVLLHGAGAAAIHPPANVLGGLVTLRPGGAGSLPYVGAAVLLAALAAVLARPNRAMLPALAVTGLGAGAVALARLVALPPLGALHPSPGWAGPGLLVAATGLLGLPLAAARPGAAGRSLVRCGRFSRLLAGFGVAGVLLLSASDLLAGRGGPLRPGDGARLAAPQRADLARTQRSVLVMSTRSTPVRMVASRTPAFGDGDLAPQPGAVGRLAGWDAHLRASDRRVVAGALAQAAAAGALFLVVPDTTTARRVRRLAGPLVSTAPPTADGRPVLRLRIAGGPVELISPELAHRAITGGTPPTSRGGREVTSVDTAPPDVGARVSEGSRGRLLVVSAEYESGWDATVDGKPVPLTTAWGHLISVSVPEDGADIRITDPNTLRSVLLVVQGAAMLFTLLAAIPTRRL
jgi:GT2 family glycosyltransferase